LDPDFAQAYLGTSQRRHGIINPDFDELLDKMNAESDLEERRELLFEMQRIMAEELPYGGFLRPDRINPVRTDKFEGYVETMGGVSTWINP
jgi:peptide/nickel transport system substrate-binding protein